MEDVIAMEIEIDGEWVEFDRLKLERPGDWKGWVAHVQPKIRVRLVDPATEEASR